MAFLDGFDFNPLSFSPANGAAPDFLSQLLRKGQQMGGLLTPQDHPIAQPPNNEPFRMPSGTQSLNAAPLPEIITGGPAAATDGSALSFAPKPASSGGLPLPRPRPDGAPDEEGATLPAAAQPAQGGMLSTAGPEIAPAAPASFLGGLGQKLSDNSGLLIGLGAGLAGAPSWGAGISRGLAGAAAGAEGDKKLAGTNLTYAALLKKGVDPQIAQAAVANPELMKTLVAQNFGPQTVTALGSGYIYNPKTEKVTRAFEPDDKMPLSLGNGYIYNPKSGKTERAYEPDDKIPAGFAKGDDGNLRFIPGGPADPAYIQLSEAKKKDPNGVYTLGRGGELYKIDKDGQPVIVHKNEAEAPAPMEPDALEILARREIGGDFSGRKNLGRGAQGAADLKAITNKSSEILTKEMGMSPVDAAAHLLKKQQEYHAQGQGLNSEARTTGVREANLNLILKAADAAIPAALEASDKVARSGWVPLNRIIQRGEVMTSNPELKKFGMANLQLAEHWARAMNPTGVMRESDRDKALEFLSTADSKETYKAAVGQLRTQIERERDAVRSTRGMSTMPGVPPESAPRPGAPPKAGTYIWTPGGGLVPGA